MIARKRRYLPSIDYYQNANNGPQFNSPLPSEFSIQGAPHNNMFKNHDDISGGASLFGESLKKKNLNASFIQEDVNSQERGYHGKVVKNGINSA